MIRIASVGYNTVDQVTKVKIEIYESFGTMIRLKDILELTLKGMLEVGEDLDEAIGEELQRNNYEYYNGNN